MRLMHGSAHLQCGLSEGHSTREQANGLALQHWHIGIYGIIHYFAVQLGCMGV